MAPGGGVRIDWRGKRAILTLESGPSNALSAALRAELLAALSEVRGAEGIVMCGAGAGFSSALPLEPESGTPTLAQLCQAVETLGLPIVAALHGLVMGSGAELALAATARVAMPGTRLVLPHVALGLCPEGGTTRRLPLLIGPASALDLMISGRAVALDEGLKLGLFDARADEAPVDAALALLGAINPVSPGPDPAVWGSAVAGARRGHAGALPAVGRIIDCVEAALLLPTDAAQAFETVAREDLEASAEAQGLRSAARAERRAATLPQSFAQAHAVERIGLSGQAPALLVLAEAAVAGGLEVTWQVADQDRAAIITGLETALAARQRRGQISTAARAAAMARLHLEDQAQAGIELRIVTLPPGRPDAGTVLVLDGAPGMLGLSIAPSGRASELALPAEDGVAGVAVAVATLRRIGLPPLLVSGRPGLGARVMLAGDAALRWMFRAGVPQRGLAAALEAFGAPIPMLTSSTRPTPREMSVDEVLRRWLAAQANEGLRLVEAGIARRPSDIDLALVAGHAFPRWQGGPMHQADRRGLMVLRHDLRLWAGDDAIWQPAPLLDRLINRGLRLSALDG